MDANTGAFGDGVRNDVAAVARSSKEIAWAPRVHVFRNNYGAAGSGCPPLRADFPATLPCDGGARSGAPPASYVLRADKSMPVRCNY